MKFYNRQFNSNYEELISYYPRFYRDVYEMVEILKAHGRIVDKLEDTIEQTYLNNFILEADEATIEIWESLLNITYTESLKLSQRKSVVIARLGGNGHIGEPEIRGIIANYTENNVTVDFAFGIITIVIDGNVFDEINLLNTLLRRIPAHLSLNMSIHIHNEYRYNQKIKFGGMSIGHLNFALTDVHRIEKSETSDANGVFCHTHIKSKLID